VTTRGISRRWNRLRASTETSGTSRLARVNQQKRIFDTACLLAAMPVVLPVGLAVSAAVRVIDGAPVLFRQTRTGRDGQPFEILKFRTMSPGDGRNNDSARITKLGRVLRKTSLDEVPQLWNVFKGEMSLVGPRPLYPEYVPHYTQTERLRHAVRPGITGLSQVSGRNSLRWSNRLAKDVEYVSTASLRQDVSILVTTVRKALARAEVAAVPRDTGEPLNVERSYPRDSTFAIRRLNLLDAPVRVDWMNHDRTRRYMQIPFTADVQSMEAWYHRVKQDPWRDDFVVYRHSDDQPVAMLGLKSEPGSARGELYIFVAPDRAGEGIGTAAMQLLLTWARTSRYETVTLAVGEDNQSAWRLYERLGFTRGVDEAAGRRSYDMAVSTEGQLRVDQ
jgi:lipopolysaccharide/colanic/teichoic acid biosynthesis glycosyltransferase/RimJ/RimL family protein N-acetyltransferase